MQNFNGALPNGVELYTCLNPKLTSFCLTLWVREGAMHDPPERHGLAHFLEHATFRAISERLDGRLYHHLRAEGLAFDACTSDSHVRFELSGPVAAFPAALRLLLWILEPPVVSVAGLQRERLRVQAEIRENAAEDATDYFARRRVWPGTPLCRTIEGTAASVNRMGFDALREAHARWFRRGNFFVSAAGSVPDMDGLVAALSALNPTAGAPPTPFTAPVPEGFLHREAAVCVDDRSFTHLTFAFDVDTASCTEAELTLMEEYLLGDSGALYLALSEDTGLTYAVDGYTQVHDNAGCLMFDFDVEPARAVEAVSATVAALNAAKHAPDAADFLRGYVSGERLRADTPQSMASCWGFDNGLRRNGFAAPEDRLAAYASVTPDRLRALLRETFTAGRCTLCAFGSPRRLREDALREPLFDLGEA